MRHLESFLGCIYIAVVLQASELDFSLENRLFLAAINISQHPKPAAYYMYYSSSNETRP